MDRRTFLVAGAGAVVLAACSSKSGASDDPELAASKTDAPPTTAATTAPTTAATTAPTTAAASAAPTAAPARAGGAPRTADAGANDNPTGITSPPNAHAAEAEVRLGTIAVAKLNLNTTLFEGVTLTTLNKVGVGHWPGTALPGQTGNMVVAGHRVTHSRPFRNIDTLGPGDEVIFTIGGGQHTYTFASNEIVPPNAMRIVSQGADATATLFACHPPGSARFRFVVHLTYVGSTTV
jgi:sortase A